MPALPGLAPSDADLAAPTPVAARPLDALPDPPTVPGLPVALVVVAVALVAVVGAADTAEARRRLALITRGPGR